MNDVQPKVVNLPQLVTVPDVEICAAGTWDLSTGPATFTAEDFAAAVSASQCPSVGSPVLKLGHVDPRFDGEPAVGRVANLRLTASGAKLTGDLAGMPAWLGAVLGSAYPNRSIEGIYGYQCQIGHKHPFVITGLALLGVEKPGVGVLSSLKDVAALYGVAAAAGDQGSAWTLRLGGVMADAPNPTTTVEDIRRAYYDSSATPPTWWITEIQLSPLQMIVADEAEGCLYRVPVKLASDGSVQFGDPVPVQVTYVDSPQETTTAAASAGTPVGRALAVAAKLRGQAGDQLAQLAAMRRVGAAWNGPQQVKNLGSDPSGAQIKALFALPADTKSDSKLPHHDVSSDGTVGDADVDGVEAALAALNGSQGGLKDVSDADRQKAYNHLSAHYKTAGKTAPPLQASGGQPDDGKPQSNQQNPAGEGPANSGPVHGQFVGTHSHPHSAYGSQGGDAAHEHEHTHSGDAQHDHHGTATSASSMNATMRGAADMQFSDTELAALRAKLGKGDSDELTSGEILTALGVQASAPAAAAAPAQPAAPTAPQAPIHAGAQAGAVPAGLMLVDEATWQQVLKRLDMGEQARREQLHSRRDQIIQGAISAGKTPPSRREHWQKAWEVDPEGTEQVLASLAPGLIPLSDIGKPGGEPNSEDRELTEYRALFGEPNRPASQA